MAPDDLQEQHSPLASTELVAMLASMDLSAIVTDDRASSPGRRAFPRQSLGPLTDASPMEVESPPKRAASSLTAGQRAAALFGVGASDSVQQGSHWAARGFPGKSPTKPLARPRAFFKRSATVHVESTGYSSGHNEAMLLGPSSSTDTAPGTPDPRRRFARTQTDPLTRSMSITRPAHAASAISPKGSPHRDKGASSMRQLAGTKRPCMTPPSRSPSHCLASSCPRQEMHQFQLTLLKKLPRAPAKRLRRTATNIDVPTRIKRLDFDRFLSSFPNEDPQDTVIESSNKRVRRTGSETDLKEKVRRYMPRPSDPGPLASMMPLTLDRSTTMGELEGTQGEEANVFLLDPSLHGRLLPTPAPYFFGSSSTTGTSSNTAHAQPIIPYTAPASAATPTQQQQQPNDYFSFSLKWSSPHAMASPAADDEDSQLAFGGVHLPEPPSPCFRQMEKAQAAQAVELLVHSLEADLKF
ncbi:uncharacterized protein EV422DRAFT_617441 [Fimicolochytrium jonesii]|uniref:uncharacterized protein n=1 Tax=Fimicolochytrium jonesii TaxID=1396493 RepID=UPI0022FEE3A5|nr:uncharacterized protein EV422DRAFT_617441 [Fimicolochytrium jonesii]KAI8824998.1 hypothetical protein EV422DRAFT_617441 [Fimicolochytrium jonesii]